MYHRGSRRVQLIVNMVAMFICLLGLSYVLSGDQALKQLNFDTSVAVRHLADQYAARAHRQSESVAISPRSHNFTGNFSEAFMSAHSTEKTYPTESPSIEPSRAPTAYSSEAPTATPSTGAPIFMDYQYSDSVQTSRVIILVCMFSFLFFFWAGVGVLSWLLTVESFPMRIRAKGTAVVFGILVFLGINIYYCVGVTIVLQ